MSSRGATPDAPVDSIEAVLFGRNCRPCAADESCTRREQCASQICRAGTCREPGCFDGIQNALETDFDCGGGDCAPCPVGFRCIDHADCLSGNCDSLDGADGPGRCDQARCDDGLQNASESDVDCGGPACDECADGNRCINGTDCLSGVCSDGICISCRDNVQNADETDVDCGGSRCDPCNDASRCEESTDCLSNICVESRCISCGDEEQNGLEKSDIDCGGLNCDACSDGQLCRLNEDCASEQCAPNGRCISCDDGLLNGQEVEVGLRWSDLPRLSNRSKMRGRHRLYEPALFRPDMRPIHLHRWL